MWLTSNNVWMYGELQDLSTYGDWGTTYAECTIIAGDIMLSAFCIYIFFFMFLRPSTWLDHDRYELCACLCVAVTFKSRGGLPGLKGMEKA